MEFCWERACHQELRELGWSLFSPAILETGHAETVWTPALDNEALHLMSQLDREPGALRRHLASARDRRLGGRLESLWEFFLENHSFYRVLARNLQIFAGSRTLGSLDFLIEDHLRRCIVHLELAVKFYLYLPEDGGTGLQRWIGPNPDDNLDLKYRHLVDHQLPLSTTVEALSTLKKRGLPSPDLRVAIVKGYLFSPLGTSQRVPFPVTANHLQEEWVRFRDRDKLAMHYPDCRWRVLEKETWLDPRPRPVQSLATTNASALCQKSLPTLLLGDNDNASRCFVVPDHWPQR